MKYTALALAMMGFAVGTMFQLRVLLLIVVLLFLLSIVFALASGFSILQAGLTVIAVQAIFQSSYFVGLVAKALLTSGRRE